MCKDCVKQRNTKKGLFATVITTNKVTKRSNTYVGPCPLKLQWPNSKKAAMNMNNESGFGHICLLNPWRYCK